jgi:hypothetical protein
MSQGELTETAVEELLSGRAAPEDVAPELRRVAELLGELSRIDSGVAPEAKREVVPMLAGIVGAADPASATVPALVSRRRVLATVAIAACSACLVFGGLGAANALPESAQRTVSDLLAKVGVDVPRPNDPPDGGASLPVPSTSPSPATASNGPGAEPVPTTSPGTAGSSAAANLQPSAGATTAPSDPPVLAPAAATPAPTVPPPDPGGPPYGNGKGLGPGNGKGLGPGNGKGLGPGKPPA